MPSGIVLFALGRLQVSLRFSYLFSSIMHLKFSKVADGTRNCLTVYLNNSFYCSVWSSLPPVKASSSSEKKVVLAITSMDSASFFRDRTLGVDSPLSVSISSSSVSVQFLYSTSLEDHFGFSYATGIAHIIGSCGCSLKSF